MKTLISTLGSVPHNEDRGERKRKYLKGNILGNIFDQGYDSWRTDLHKKLLFNVAVEQKIH